VFKREKKKMKSKIRNSINNEKAQKAEANSATANQLPVEAEELLTRCSQLFNFNVAVTPNVLDENENTRKQKQQ
jgi:hypothetical protein